MKKLFSLVVAMVLVLCGMAATNATADLYQVTHEVTYTEEAFYDIPCDSIFGEDTGPVHVTLTFLIDTEGGPLYYYPEGSTITVESHGERTALNDFYGYDASAISNLSVTFGTNTWDTDDLTVPNFGIGDAGVWFDAALADGATPNIVIDLWDSDGRINFGWMQLAFGGIRIYQDGTSDITDFTIVECSTDTNGGTSYVSISPCSGLGGDTDGDGVCDDLDSCPDEDSTGFDTNGDGCIDSVSGLAALIQTLVDGDIIDEQMQNSLHSKIYNASKSADKENICAAVHQLEAFINQVNAQTGNKISKDATGQVIPYAQSVIDWYLDQLPEGETCQ